MSATQKTAFARKLETLMLDRGWNASEMARRATLQLPKGGSRAEISRQDVSKYLAGVVAPSPVTLKAMADALHVETNSLYNSAAMPVPRPPEQVAKGNAESASMRQVSPGVVWLSISQAVPWPKALEIMNILKGHK